jgi:microcin C transport system substrate-binding protein
VRFVFKTTENRKLPFLLAKFLPVLSKAWWSGRDFSATTLDIPVTNGPYLIDAFDVGKYIVYRRNESYWGKDLPVNRGFNNFDRVRFEYFLDDDVQFEAFKTNGYDYLREVTARRWATGYDFPAVRDKRVVKMEVPDILPKGAQPVYFNLRRPLFQDRRVREALGYAFDFESLNASLFYGQYVRSRSYWQGSPLEATGLPSEAELTLLEPFRGKVPEEVFTTEFTHPVTKGDGNLRDNLLKARELLDAAGWLLKDGVLVNGKTGQLFTFEFLIRQQGTERVYLPFVQNLERLGIKASLRMVDTSQFINRLNTFDYDATVVVFPRNDLTPGPEQRDNWGSEVADVSGANNLSGVKDPVVDALIDKIVAAETYEDVTAATKALDRVLTWNYYQMLTYTAPVERYAFWTTKLAMPEKTPPLGLGMMGEFSDGLGETAVVLWWAASANAASPGAPPAESAGGPSRWVGLAVGIIAAIILLVFVSRRRKA